MKGADQGLTLMEVLVAIALFAVVSVAALALFPTVFRVSGQTQADQAVTIAAKQYMEQARVLYSTQTGFDSGALPSAPASHLGGYTCTAPAATAQAQNTAVTPPLALIKRVTLTCTKPSAPPLTFSLDLGRPDS
ncbi:PulJ/GspJ family protein [Deinococcus hohokamensis]|uniref:Type II secretion system protein J n=1 Tax=Deinococcus hohokamensis TaxID=309883 RepID=A0ABV9IB65_9DEIO